MQFVFPVFIAKIKSYFQQVKLINQKFGILQFLLVSYLHLCPDFVMA